MGTNLVHCRPVLYFAPNNESWCRRRKPFNTYNTTVLSAKISTSYSITRRNNVVRIGNSGRDLWARSTTQRIQTMAASPHLQNSCSGWGLEESRIHDPDTKTAIIARIINKVCKSKTCRLPIRASREPKSLPSTLADREPREIFMRHATFHYETFPSSSRDNNFFSGSLDLVRQ